MDHEMLPLWHFAYMIFYSQLTWQRVSGLQVSYGSHSWEDIFRRKYTEGQVFLWLSGATLCDEKLVKIYHEYFERLFLQLLSIRDLSVNVCAGGINGVFLGDLLRMHAEIAKRLGRDDVCQVSMQLGRPGQEVLQPAGGIVVSTPTPNPATHVDALGLLADYMVAPAIGDGGLDEVGRILLWRKLQQFGMAQPSWSGGILLDRQVPSRDTSQSSDRVYSWFKYYGRVARRLGTIAHDAHRLVPVWDAALDEVDIVAGLIERQLRDRQEVVQREAPIVLNALDQAIADSSRCSL